MEAKDKIIVPLDVSDIDKATELVTLLSPHIGMFKIGLEFIWSVIADSFLFSSPGAAVLLSKLRVLGQQIGPEKIFIDAKLDDIPNTIAGASRAISRLGVRMFNLHASAGREAIIRAVENKGDALVLGVTVLTSIGEEDCVSIFGKKPGDKVLDFAFILKEAAADGIICSPEELKFFSYHPQFDDLLKVTPGIRPEWAAKGDQKRVMTPAEAIEAGADYLVIGRPITKPPEEIGGPIDAAKKIVEEISQALAEGGK